LYFRNTKNIVLRKKKNIPLHVNLDSVPPWASTGLDFEVAEATFYILKAVQSPIADIPLE